MVCFCAAGSFVARKKHEADLPIVRCGSDAVMDFAIPQKHDRFFENRSNGARRRVRIKNATIREG
jgi:hypothetical protein